MSDHDIAKIVAGLTDDQRRVLVDEMRALPALTKYSDEQARDGHGRWTSGGNDGATTIGSDATRHAQRAADSAKEARHQLKLVAEGLALKGAVALGAVLAPEAAVGAVGVAVIGFAEAQAKNLLQRAAIDAGFSILKDMGVDTSRVEGLIHTVGAIFKAAGQDGSDAELLAALRPHLSAALNDTAAALKAKTREKYPDAPGLSDAMTGINNALTEAQARLRSIDKAVASNEPPRTVGDLLKRQADDFAGMARDLRTLNAETGDALAKADGFSPGLRKSLTAIYAQIHVLSAKLDHLARQPLPMPLRSVAAAGNAKEIRA